MTLSRARSWTHSSQLCALRKTAELSVLHVQVHHVRDGGTVHLAQQKDSQALAGQNGGYAAVLLSGQVCSRDNTAAVVQGYTDEGVTWLCAWAPSHSKLWWVWYVDTQMTLHTAGLVSSALALARLDLCSLLPSRSIISVLQFSYQHDFSITCSSFLASHHTLLFSTLEKGLSWRMFLLKITFLRWLACSFSNICNLQSVH